MLAALNTAVFAGIDFTVTIRGILVVSVAVAILMPAGDYRIQDKKVTPPPRGRIDESMEALIHHFKIFTEGFKVPEGEVYVAVESPRGEIGCYIASDGSAKPYRMTRYAWRSVRYLPGAGPAEIQRTLADAEVAAQIGSGDVVVVAGRGNLAESQAAAVSSLRAVLDAVPNARVLPALRRGNVVGALQLGLAPSDADHDATATLRAAADGKLDLLVLLGADPINDCPDAALARRALAGARRILSIDTFLSDSTKQADLVLAAAAFGEQDGTTTNLDGHVTPVAQAVTAHGTARPDWMLAAELALMFGRDVGFDSIESGTASVASTPRRQFGALPAGVASEPAANSYDYRLVVSRKLYDRAVGTSNSPSLAPLAGVAGAHIHPLDLDRVGVAAGTDVKLVGVRGSIVLPLVADEAVQRGTIWAPFNHEGADITDLVDAGASVTDLRIERL